ncbi:2-oxoacid:acceptor oxidoreductase subunit alpha [Opitutus sp. ER46]|uniref:2-oxoacid:acceptor oxidoreductase subunit alpha n=1 Tax=Opitutus sp. ER46 TaxID=2161864 RepID=UPI000D314027|nr:2-oxoacid:acceptor oxidoreductase subunit alpha [Opitutus sp. ER46]PTY00496.1 2-oxoacid:acceptor oxidoreductase subunit alpha [Opitutus sp. ER46]
MASPHTPEATGAATAVTRHAPHSIQDVVIRLAGNSQDGIQTIGGFLARLAGRSDQDVMTYMTIPSTISGGPSIFQVRMGTGEILSAGDRTDMLVAFYQHSYDAHIASLRPGGVLVYDTDHVKPNPDDHRFTQVAVPITTGTVEAVGGAAKDKGKNMFVLGFLARVFDLDVAKLAGLIKERFGGKDEDIVRNAMLAFDAGYGWPQNNLRDLFYRFEAIDRATARTGRPQVTMDGNTALAYGLIAAGIRHGAGYPITPWSSIMEILRTELPKYGGTFVQCEDEIASISTALGFSYSGQLAITGSSGPGLSLKMEALGWAVMAEMPLIVINVQRGGPSTGMPTNVEQSDLMQAIYGSHGDSPRVVLAPRNVEDCFHIALEAARIARDYSTPVLILTDQGLSSRIEAFDEPDFAALMVNPAPDLSERPADFKPYPLDAITRHAPPGARIASGKFPTVTGLEHDELGHPTGSPKLHQQMTAKRREKLKTLAASLPLPEVTGDDAGDVLLVTWGSGWGPGREALTRVRQAGLTAGHLHLRHLNPLPNGLEPIFARYRRIVVAELNDEGLYGFGQLALLLRARFANPAIVSVCKTDGLTFKVSELVAGIGRHLESRTLDTAVGAATASALARPAPTAPSPTASS